MELINGKPFEYTKDAFKFLGIAGSTLSRKVDTTKPIIVKGVSYLAFRKELSSKLKSDLLNNNSEK